MKILELLKKNYRKVYVPVPSYWNYSGLKMNGEIKKINIFDLMINTIEDYVPGNRSVPLPGSLDQAVIYGAFIRTTTAFDFDGDNRLRTRDRYGLRETGTILRMFLLFPLLKKMGVNMVYLLPVTSGSRQFRKGRAPSPYACKNFFKIDEELYDPMLGEYSEEKLEILFREFVDTAHSLGIKVMVDFIPRTAARDNDLILDHPDWFYWIKKEFEKDFRPPVIEGVPFTSYDKKYVKQIYSSSQTREFLKKFSVSPDRIDRKKWLHLVKKVKKENIPDFMGLISKEFGLTTVPGFSDVINDIQPLWTETSFLRMFMDLPVDSARFVGRNQPPYALFDIIKSSKAPGRKPNHGLWNLISSVLPYWQKQFNIDGVRIDMAHALPVKLEERILKTAVKVNKNFILIAEELDNRNSAKAARAGYHAIIGNFWAVEPRWKDGNFKNVFENDTPHLKLPLMATSETHDTPRTVSRPGKDRFYYFSLVLNYFLPRTVTFINTGFELRESHPMNKGLDSAHADIHGLAWWDLNYGKMALFDYTCLHWKTNNEKAIRLMEYCQGLLKEYPEIKQSGRSRLISTGHPYILSFFVPVRNDILLFAANSDMNRGHKFLLNLPFPPIRDYDVLLSTHVYRRKNRFSDERAGKRISIKMNGLIIKMKRSEVLVLRVRSV
ncbi:MAG: hypothetical protein PHF84_03930 [bacterium]|nr:hypothetical protein [bacterium]